MVSTWIFSWIKGKVFVSGKTRNDFLEFEAHIKNGVGINIFLDLRYLIASVEKGLFGMWRRYKKWSPGSGFSLDFDI